MVTRPVRTRGSGRCESNPRNRHDGFKNTFYCRNQSASQSRRAGVNPRVGGSSPPGGVPTPVACYLGKAKNPNASVLEMLDPLTHKFCGRAQKVNGDVRSAINSGVTVWICCIGSLDRRASSDRFANHPLCVCERSKLGSLRGKRPRVDRRI